MNDLDNILRQISQTVKPPYTYNQSKFVPGETPVYYSGPYWDDKEVYYALKAFLTSPWLPTGENVREFQDTFSKMFDVNHAHMVNSGSSANLVMVTALKKYHGWQDDDEVIVSPVGFPTTIAPLIQNNLKPIFADIEFETLNFDLDQVEAKITPRTKAIFVSPVLGNPPDMDRLMNMCFDHNIMLIGDNCDSLGTKWNGEYLTNMYSAWTTSFYPAHHITTGEGGMICSNDEKLMDLVRSISWWGRDCYCVGANNLLSCGTCGKRFDKWLDGYDGIIDHKYLFTNVGYNLKPLDLQGAIGLAQLEKFDTIERLRRDNKVTLGALVENYVSGTYIARHHEAADPSWFGVPIVCESQALKEKLVAFFEANKIQTRSYFAGNVLMHPAYSDQDDYRKYPNANQALSRVFFLGCPPHYGVEVFNYIENTLKGWK